MSQPPDGPCPLLWAQAPLSSAQWRCLRVVSEVGDVAHAARKLHCSQALLKAALADLQACVGAQHLALRDERVQLSQALQEWIRQPASCRPENAAAGPGGRVACPSPTQVLPVPPGPVR